MNRRDILTRSVRALVALPLVAALPASPVMAEGHAGVVSTMSTDFPFGAVTIHGEDGPEWVGVPQWYPSAQAERAWWDEIEPRLTHPDARGLFSQV